MDLGVQGSSGGEVGLTQGFGKVYAAAYKTLNGVVLQWVSSGIPI